MASVEARAPGPPGNQDLNHALKKDLFQVNADLYTAVSLWLRKHGKGVKPKLSDEQKQQMKECFELMDQDGSGAIDAEELGAAFKLLGIRMKRAELAALLAEVDHDGSGEVEYPEFLEIMTVTLQRLAEEEDSEKNEGQVPFALMATAYRRKRLMEGIINGHKEVQAQIQQISDKANLEALQATKAAEMEALRAKAVDPGGSSSCGGNGMAQNGRTHSGRPLRRIGQVDVNKSLLDTMGADERRIITALTAKGPPCSSRAPPPPLNLMGGNRQYGHFANSPSHRQLMDTPQLLDLRFVHQSTIRLPPGVAGYTRSMSGGLNSGQGPAAGTSGGGATGTFGAPREPSLSGVPPIGAAALRRSTSNLRVGMGPQMGPTVSGALAAAATAPVNSPGRMGRSDELPQLRYEGGMMSYPGAKQPMGVRLGTHSARHERTIRGG